MVTQRKHIQHGTFVGAHPHIKKLWFERDLEPELLSGEPIPELEDEHDPMHDRDARVLLARLLEKCTKREAIVLTMRYIQEMTLEEAGEKLQVTAARVRQIEVKAIRRAKLRSMSDKDVRSFFR